MSWYVTVMTVWRLWTSSVLNALRHECLKYAECVVVCYSDDSMDYEYPFLMPSDTSV